MARLAAKEKILFYPTPIEMIHLIASNIKPGTSGRLLDPCCGTGEPLAVLGQLLGLTTYGNELHPARFNQARIQLDYCLNGAREFLQVDGWFNVVFDNPPYDQGLSGQRMESEHIRQDLELLMPGGVGLWVIPEPILDYELLSLLVTHLNQVNLRRFPLPEYERFKQVVVFGVKRATSATMVYASTMQLEKLIANGLPVLQAHEFSYTIPVADQPITRFEIQFPEANTILSEVEAAGIQVGEAWRTLFGSQSGGMNQFQPLLKLSSGHTAFAIAAGLVDGTEVTIEGQCHILKGSTRKDIAVITETETTEAGKQQVIRERERLVQTITALNLENGTLAEYNSLQDKDGFAAFLLEHQQILVDTIERTYAPLFDPDRDMASWLPILHQVQAPGVLPGQQHQSGLLPAQQVRAAALATRLKTTKGTILVGEMGTGKTVTSLGIAPLIGRGNWKLVVVCPAQIVAKWKREAEAVLRAFGVQVHLIGQPRRQPDGQGKLAKVSKPVLDTIRAMEEPNPSILVMSYETAKNGPRWEHTAWVQQKILKYRVAVEEPIPSYPFKQIAEKIVTKVQRVVCCPDCGQVLQDEYGAPYVLSEQWQAKGELQSLLGKKKRWCSCGAALWQQVPFSYGGRTAMADFLNRHYSGRYNLILDECFPSGTLVSTPHGPIPIERVTPGSVVFGSKDGNLVERSVTRAIRKRLQGSLVRVDHEQGSLVCTPNHNIYVDGQYVQADNLKQGQTLSIASVPRLDRAEVLELANREGTASSGNSHSKVLSVTPILTEDEYVYNLEVEEVHNYFAEGVLVSNCHHTKGSDTDVGYASADLVAGARKVIAMTGTLYSGKASSIFYVLYRLFPQFRQLYDYNEVQRFIEHHGLQETITTVKNSRSYSSAYGYNRENVRVRELPGVSPGMVTMLLPNTAFLKLADMDLHLPSYTEERLPIPLDDRLNDGLSDIASVYDQAAKLAREGKPGLLSAWLYASLGWMDCPIDETLTAQDEEGKIIASCGIQGVLASNDELLEEPLLKDQVLLDLVEAELAEGRGVGIYFAQVNRRDWMGRIQALLKKKGIYSEILRQSTCKPEERETWYRNFVQRCRMKGQEPVLLANGNLVKEGLDLIELPTLIETGIEYRINDLRQRDRRSWRLIQDRPVRVIFLYYQNSWQETALQLVAAKLKAALLVDGDLAEGLAAMDVDDGNLMDALMKAVSAGQSKKVEWSGMEIAAVAKPKPVVQPVLLPDLPQPVETDLEIVQVDVGGAVQLSWFDMEVATMPKPARKPRQAQVTEEPTELTTTKVKVKGGGIQYSFL